MVTFSVGALVVRLIFFVLNLKLVLLLLVVQVLLNLLVVAENLVLFILVASALLADEVLVVLVIFRLILVSIVFFILLGRGLAVRPFFDELLHLIDVIGVWLNLAFDAMLFVFSISGLHAVALADFFWNAVHLILVVRRF